MLLLIPVLAAGCAHRQPEATSPVACDENGGGVRDDLAGAFGFIGGGVGLLLGSLATSESGSGHAVVGVGLLGIAAGALLGHQLGRVMDEPRPPCPASPPVEGPL